MAATMNPEHTNTPLFVRVPQTVHDYLDSTKEITGISKNDTAILFFHVMSQLVDAETLVKMYDEYMLEGDVVSVFLRNITGHG